MTRLPMSRNPLPLRPAFRWAGTLLLSLLLGATGCQSPADDRGSGYETVAGESLHDTDAARQHNVRGLEALQRNDLDLAEQAFKQALEADVMFGPAHNNLGKVYFAREHYYKAAWEYQYAIKLMPYHPEPKYNLGLVYETVGKLDEAVNLYNEARGLEPDNPILIGNVARARIKRGDKGSDMRDLLSELIMKDTREDWLAWAREKLALMRAD